LDELNYKPNGNGASKEKEIFDGLKLNYVNPLMREQEYLQYDKKLRTESDLEFSDMKGLLHFHTTYSDGNNTLEEIINFAKENGFEYASVCDHSKSAFYANGLDEDRILQEKEEVKKVSENLDFTVYQGIESDILKNGGLDFEKDFMMNFDFVVASVHSVFNLSEDDMTARIIKAVENEHTDVLGHPTGRLLLTRDAYDINQQKVIDACKENNVAIEINANPHRLDLDWRWIWYAREKGCLLSINADAHSTDEINLTEYGILIARKAGLQKKEVINYFSKEDFIKFLNRKIKRII
jgi:DNA polymerase (family 10)